MQEHTAHLRGSRQRQQIIRHGQEPRLLPPCPLRLLCGPTARARPMVATVIDIMMAPAGGAIMHMTATALGTAAQHRLDRLEWAKQRWRKNRRRDRRDDPGRETKCAQRIYGAQTDGERGRPHNCRRAPESRCAQCDAPEEHQEANRGHHQENTFNSFHQQRN